jgi:hypothetical protein
VKYRARQFIYRRRRTWFRRQLDPEWIELNPDELLEKYVRRKSPSSFEVAERRAIIAHGETVGKLHPA